MEPVFTKASLQTNMTRGYNPPPPKKKKEEEERSGFLSVSLQTMPETYLIRTYPAKPTTCRQSTQICPARQPKPGLLGTAHVPRRKRISGFRSPRDRSGSFVMSSFWCLIWCAIFFLGGLVWIWFFGDATQGSLAIFTGTDRLELQTW